MAADLVAFDPQTVANRQNERRWDFPGGTDRLVSASTGVEHAWVGGQAIRRHGADLEATHPGQLVSA